MNQKTKKQTAYWLKVVVVGIALGFTLQFVRAWTEPNTDPPGGNVGAPINTGGDTQTKTGVLGAGWLWSQGFSDSNNSGYYIDPSGYSNVNTMQPTYSFNGQVYDYSDGNYYLDPNGNSRMNALYSNNIQNYGQITNNGDIYSYGRVCSNVGGWKCLDSIAPPCTCYFTGYDSCIEIVDKYCPWGSWNVSTLQHYGGGVGHWCSASGSYSFPCY